MWKKYPFVISWLAVLGWWFHLGSVAHGHERGVQSTDNQVMYGFYSDCGADMECFGYPSSCVENRSCEILFIYTSAPDGVVFGMVADVSTTAEEWIAVGLSEDDKMGDDSVTECMNQPTGGVIVQQSWNVAEPSKGNVVLDNLEEGISKANGSVSDGTMYCFWKRKFVTNIKDHTFDLINQQFFLLLAKGPVGDNGVKAKHTVQIASNSSVLLSSGLLKKNGYLVKIHGVFMIIAWISFVGVRAVLARIYNKKLKIENICSFKSWIVLHRALWIVSMVLIISAIICIFVYVGGWSFADSPHPVWGCICTGFAVIQSFMVFVRPPSNHLKKLCIFIYAFLIIENAGQIMAVKTLFHATDLPAARLNSGFYYVLIGFLVCYFLFHIVLKIHDYVTEKKANSTVELQDMSQEEPVEVTKESVGEGFRRWMLGIYIVFNISFSITLVLLVVVH